METVGFIGIGRMGTPMSQHIQKAGYPMVVFDIHGEAVKPLVEGGARQASSPSEVAGLSDVVFTSLPAPKDVEAVATGANGILEGIREGSVYVDLSTCGPELIRSLEPAFQQKGVEVMDAPVLSGPALAAERKLIVMVGGKKDVFDRVQHILPAFSDQVIYAGPLGSGCICKIVFNMGWISASEVIAEMLTLAVKAGVRLEAVLESGSRDEVGGILGTVGPYLAQTWFKEQFDNVIFTVALARKDIGLATQLGRDHGVPLPAANLAEQNMMQGLNRGWADKDWMIWNLIQEERAGVKVRISEGGK